MPISVGYGVSSVPSGNLSLAQPNQTNAYDVASQGIGFLGSLIKLGRARKDDQQTIAKSTLDTIEGLSKKNSELVKGFMSVDPENPTYHQALNAKREVDKIVTELKLRIANGENVDRKEIISSLEPYIKQQLTIEDVLGQENQKIRGQNFEQKKSRQAYEDIRATTGGPDARQKEQARVISQGGASMNEMPQFIQRGSASALLPVSPSENEVNQVLGPQDDQTRLARARGTLLEMPKQEPVSEKVKGKGYTPKKADYNDFVKVTFDNLDDETKESLITEDFKSKKVDQIAASSILNSDNKAQVLGKTISDKIDKFQVDVFKLKKLASTGDQKAEVLLSKIKIENYLTPKEKKILESRLDKYKERLSSRAKGLKRNKDTANAQISSLARKLQESGKLEGL